MTVKIAGKKTVSEWNALSAKLKHDPTELDWNHAIQFFDERINERYLEPVERIRGDGETGNLKGAGFAICTLLCALVENLETFYRGINFKPKPQGAYEYGNGCSRTLFTDFLKTKEPFINYFGGNDELANSFYTGVRCSLLHDASTCDGWVINITGCETVSVNNGKKILHRSLFMSDIRKYIGDYRNLLLQPGNQELKDAFIRKFDGICAAAI
ncbi:hypothetical protein MLE08_001554 [Klebsiella aerogenes]|nr:MULTISPECIES: hypothetical protein [Enterobacteriaceae]HCT4795769.1 hypothetical protein [Enterobacter hormaechei]HDZ9648405.1 hypothetical protein [Klebsiella pneumoniae]EIX9025407.1 hypothetical protein [Klebsiella aerogenes]KLV88354.1 hypothetical protein SK41_03325 [Klebsiella aerogenes]HDS4881751.1 hypothetical protein [Klebsiella aerogenes]